MLYIVIILLVLALCYVSYRNYKGRLGERYLTAVHAKCLADYYALEKGMDEQADNYEQQFLTFNETIETQRLNMEDKEQLIKELEARLEDHDRYCLPTVNGVRFKAYKGAIENA